MKLFLKTFAAIGFAFAAMIAGLLSIKLAGMDYGTASGLLVLLFAAAGGAAGWNRVK
jgi:hypothetical protein